MWYGLEDMAGYMIWPGGHGMVFFGLADMALYMVWPVGHGIVFGMAWEGVAWYMVLPG